MSVFDDTFLIVFVNMHTGKVAEVSSYHSQSRYNSNWDKHVDKYGHNCFMIGLEFDNGDYIQIDYHDPEM